MSSKLQPVRGTHDILPESCGGEFEKFHAVVTRARELATLYGFKEMATPIFETTEVFARSMGETSDVVSKEMFTFDTKGGESVTLRPEFTAGIARSFISNGLQQHLPLKLFSTGPLFRYERPQKGRQRQFHQVNYEWLGDDSPEADVEIILLAGMLLYSLSGQRCTLFINSLGDKESREKYRDALVAYLTPFTAELSEDSQRRLVSNPLRILDSKDPCDKQIVESAPKITDYLTPSANERFEYIYKVLTHEDTLFPHDVVKASSLVRGLDYYTDTVFEFTAETGELGAQNTVLAGGRYDGLVEQMGGKPTPAVGFAAGVERLLLMLAEFEPRKNYKDIKVMMLPLEGVTKEHVHTFTAFLRLQFYTILKAQGTKQQCTVEILWQGSHKKRMERADKQKATHVIMFSPDEKIIVQDMEMRSHQEVCPDDLTKEPQKFIELFNIAKLDSRLRGNDDAGNP